MFGQTMRDLVVPARSNMGDFGAGTQYRQDVNRPGEILPQNLVVGPRSVTNTSKTPVIQLAQILPPMSRRPVSRIKSNYAFLPIGPENKAGRS